MSQIISSPIFSVMISLIAFEIGCFLYKKTNFPLLNPLLIAITLVIILLKVFGISVETYNKGGDLINFFLTPSTVILAVPLYKKLQLLKENAVPIIIGISIGSLTGMCCIILLCRIFLIPKNIDLSLIPKSVTTPIGMEVSRQLGGIPPITVAAIIITGIIGAVVGPVVFKALRIKDPIAKGIALGTSSHAIGTTKAIEMGEVEGAMSSLAIGIAGLLTVILAPLISKLFSSIMH